MDPFPGVLYRPGDPKIQFFPINFIKVFGATQTPVYSRIYSRTNTKLSSYEDLGAKYLLTNPDARTFHALEWI